MADTFIKIARVDVGAGGASSISFSSIASTFTDLCVKISVRTNRSTDPTDAIKIQFNSSTTNYTNKILYGDGASVGSGNGLTDCVFGYGIPTSTATGNIFSNGEIYIPNYANGNYKIVSYDSVGENNATKADQNFTGGLWSNTAAITSISIAPNGGTLFVEYSSATLYGILKA